MSKTCSIYQSPLGIMTIVNDGFYITNICYGNQSSKYFFNQQDRINNRVIQELNEYFQGNRKSFDVPLRFEGTDFQKKVWNALCKIPYGETRSYSDIADLIGNPNAVRAIGNANSKNPIVIIVPCHRVLTANGSLAGYNGGMYAKKKLLDLEQSMVESVNEKSLKENDTNSNQLLNIALKGTNIYEFYFYPKDELLIFPTRTAKEYSLVNRLDKAPKSFFDKYVYQGDKDAYYNMYKKIFDGEPVSVGIYRNFDGSKWFKVTLSTAEYDEDNSPLSVVGIFEEITQEKQSEFEKNNIINIHNEVLSSIDAMFIGIHRLDLKTGTIRSIRLTENVDGISINNDYDFNHWLKNILKYYHNSDKDRLMYQYSLENIIKCRDLGLHTMEETYRRLVGSKYIWISNKVLINDKNFSKDTAMILQIDVSETYQQNNIIKDLSSDYYCLYYLDLDEDTYEILRCEEIVKETIKLSSKGNYSRCMKDYVKYFVHTDDAEKMLQFTSLSNLMAPNVQAQKDISHIFRKKVGNHYEWTKIKYVLSCIGEKHMATLALKNVDENIRTELNQKQLLKYSLQKAESANQAKNNFLSKISYDIRNPLNSIMGLTSLAKENLNNTEYINSCLNAIEKSGQKLLTLINKMLDISQIENGHLDLVKTEFSFSMFIHSTLDAVFKYINEKHIKFTCTMENITVDRILGDKSRLQQLLNNLLINAIKYTNYGGTIDLKITQLNITPNNTVTYQFVVKDNGIGISQEDIDRIFQPFTRANDDRINNISGDGLGLTIVSNIVKLMDGTINVLSQLNEGSTFIATVNLSYIEKLPLNPKILPKINVLVVNSNQEELINTCNLLNGMNICTKHMFPSKEILKEIALQHQNGNDYFAILIDYNPFDAHRLDIIKDIRNMMGENTIKILLSSYDSNIKISNVINLPKPLFSFQLYNVFNELTKPITPYYINNPFKVQPLKNTHGLVIQNDEISKKINYEFLTMLGSNVDTISIDDNNVSIDLPNLFYDYILLGTNAPKSNLQKVIGIIRSMNSSVPIIAMTFHYSMDIFTELISMGIDCHTLAPNNNNIKNLVDCILNYIPKDNK